MRKEATLPASVLVAYATRSGSTQEVAESIAATLRDAGLEVDILPIRNVRILMGYRLLVLGAPLYMFRWHKDALAFLSRHQQALEELSVAVFALGPFHDEEKEWQGVRAHSSIRSLRSFPGLSRSHVKCLVESSTRRNSTSLSTSFPR